MKRIGMTLLLLIGLSMSATVSAQGESEGRAQAFEADDGAQTEDIAGGPLLIGAYAAAWLLLMAYVGRIAMIQRTTARDLALLREDLESTETKTK